MIHGRFDEQTRPFVSASVAISKAERVTKINFLISTEAGVTCLMPTDVFALRLAKVDWGETTELCGIGGNIIVYVNNTTITFVDHGNGLVVYDTPVYIYPNQKPYDEYPSILGRNMLDNWRLHYCQPENRLTADVLKHDLFIPLLISPHRPP